MPNPDDEYQRVMQTGSKALYFAQCREQNETWLPLLEKAYAKAHGDYGAIEGGWSVIILSSSFLTLVHFGVVRCISGASACYTSLRAQMSSTEREADFVILQGWVR